MMHFARRIFVVLTITVLAGSSYSYAQSTGSLEVSGRVKIAGKIEKLTRKRFFLLRGGLEANKDLLGRMRSAEVISRDCFFCSQKASPELIAWLKVQDCESPYCRIVSAEDSKTVPEFQVAYQKGLKQFRGKQAIALQWLTTNLAPSLLSVFYRQRKTAIETVFGTVKPLQSSMTDSVSVRAIFIDIPIKLEGSAKTETFLISNIVPLEFGGKSYLWACETDIGLSKKVTLTLQVPDPGKTVKRCEVIVKDLSPCADGSCRAK
jgi:hypothetical protein